MPRGPKGEKRPADVIGNAGEAEETRLWQKIRLRRKGKNRWSEGGRSASEKLRPYVPFRIAWNFPASKSVAREPSPWDIHGSE